jgi:hypothetical protein
VESVEVDDGSHELFRVEVDRLMGLVLQRYDLRIEDVIGDRGRRRAEIASYPCRAAFERAR